MMNLDTLSYFLGIEVSSTSNGYYLSQTKYTSNLLSLAELTDNKTVDTPLENNVRLNTTNGEPLSNPTLYCQLIGSLIYLTVTRLDISHVVHIVSQLMSAPRSTHYVTVLRILRYVKGNIFQGLQFSSRSTLTLRAYSNANWTGDPIDRRSTTEAGYYALANTTSELLWLRWLLQDLGVDSPSPASLHCDNYSAIQIAHNDIFHKRTKHIEIACHFIHHHLLHGVLHLVPVCFVDQLTDLFLPGLIQQDAFETLYPNSN
ncbi:hypothetical protein Acr_17g0009270 [Actinidia rufa]|uniref:Mitochondrial protein n=1 Tax=Actinidia rufa TaxID=165716 RepID=A0A7J0G3J0_9ERIC|nr:hypothetical protein Acr_17g0009270 [Actinidia rufa]